MNEYLESYKFDLDQTNQKKVEDISRKETPSLLQKRIPLTRSLANMDKKMIKGAKKKEDDNNKTNQDLRHKKIGSSSNNENKPKILNDSQGFHLKMPGSNLETSIVTTASKLENSLKSIFNDIENLTKLGESKVTKSELIKRIYVLNNNVQKVIFQLNNG